MSIIKVCPEPGCDKFCIGEPYLPCAVHDFAMVDSDMEPTDRPNNPALPNEQGDEIDAFLASMKLHHKDIAACFDDAVAKSHLKRLIQAREQAARIDQATQDLWKIAHMSRKDAHYAIKNDVAALQAQQATLTGDEQ